MALTKKDANAKYDKLRKQLKSGEISKERFKQAADRIYKMYHSDANKATRNAAKPAVKAKPAVPQSKTGAAVLELGGSNVKKIEPKKKPVKTKPTAKTESKSSAGRRNIQRQVEAQSGSKKLSQRQAEARRRRARRKGASRNLREMLARKYNRD